MQTLAQKKPVIGDTGLFDAVENLKKIIRSNIVLEEFEISIILHTLYFFMINFELPESIHMNDSTIIQKSLEQVTELKNHINLSEWWFNEYNKSIRNDVKFDGAIGFQPPFHI